MIKLRVANFPQVERKRKMQDQIKEQILQNKEKRERYQRLMQIKRAEMASQKFEQLSVKGGLKPVLCL